MLKKPKVNFIQATTIDMSETHSLFTTDAPGPPNVYHFKMRTDDSRRPGGLAA